MEHEGAKRRHPSFQKAHDGTSQVVGAAIAVHREMGPGLLESVYERCPARELELRAIPFANPLLIPVRYKGVEIQEPFRCDFVVDGCLVVEIKAVENVPPIHRARVLTYMRLIDAPLGLILNSHVETMKEGIERLILKGADPRVPLAPLCSR